MASPTSPHGDKGVLVRSAVLTAVWGYAAATWAGIAHHLFALPDLVPIAAIAAAVAAATWSFKPRLSKASGAPTLPNRAQVAE